MKKLNLLVIISTAAMAVACNNVPKQTAETNTIQDTLKPAENKIMIPVTSCYLRTIGKDSIHLKVEQFENVVTGQLSYKFHEKDSNNGDIEGRFKGDTLLVAYKFISEGKQSARQVAFLKKGEDLVEGYGDMEEKNGVMIFKNTGAINFSGSSLLTKVDCQQ